MVIAYKYHEYSFACLIFQADICHAYQIMRRNGIPEERIIVMMYDDIAENNE